MAIPLIAMAADHEEPWPVTEWVDVTRPEGLQPETVFRDTAGQLWGITTGSKSVRHGSQGALLKWDGEKRSWQRTPGVSPPRPSWVRRGAPPWQDWARPPVVILGSEGSLLAVVVSDAYQQAQQAIDGDPAPPKHGIRVQEDVDDIESRHTGKNDSLYWLDAYLYRDGKWCEPRRLNELLTTEQAFFVKHFNQQTPTPEFFDLQVSGKNLWWVEGTSVHVLDEGGIHATWTAPRNKEEKGSVSREPVGRLHAINLVLLPDGTLWHIDGLNVTALRLTRRGIEAETLPRDATACVGQGARVYVARNGRVWTYQKNPTEPEYFPSYLFRDGHWTREAVGAFLLEDNSGGLWFLPAIEELRNSSNRYNILKGDQCYRLDMPMPKGFSVGMVTPAGTDTLLAVCGGHRVFALERSKAKLGWAVRSVIGLNGPSDLAPVWLDGHGNLVTNKGRSAKLPEGKFP
jgi:hypothetical protein